MTNIPDDIMAKARGVALDVFANGSDSLDAPVAADIIAAALLSERTAQEAEIARLTAEVERLDLCLSAANKSSDENFTIALNSAFDLAKAKARTAVLEKALKPFAKAGELFPDPQPEFDQYVYNPAAGEEYSLGGNHLRAARAALTPAKEN
ncbi:MAG: hypothetical protein KDK08_27995, partial [Rhizobiaceae bacterium]|nr:hypothetical protein [Rhizobiaceae bacterium]